MEEIFDQMNNEVDKNTVDKQCAEIEKKNLLIENENLIVNCLSTQLLYDVEKSRCLDLEADMSKVYSHHWNDHLGAIMGYGDYVMGDSLPSESILALFVILRVQISLKVGLNKTVRFIRTDNGTEFVNQVMSEYYEGVGIFHQKSVPRTPQQNGIVERRNRTLVEAARTMMIFSKAPMFLWAEAVATACYTQNRSLIHTRHNKTPYELVHDKKPDLTFFRVFGALCYPTNDSENLGKFQAKADIGIFVGVWRECSYRGRAIESTTRIIVEDTWKAKFTAQVREMHGRLAPTDKELEMLFQPMFDEHLEQSRVNEPVPSATEINAQVVPPVQHQEIAEEPIHEDTPIIHDVLHPSHNLVTGDPGSAQSSSGNVNSAEPNQVNYPPDHLRR
ncbi:retrovirus-related pol polyprotein from transposon TNT 1-94 [Tanacetum coccineum]